MKNKIKEKKRAGEREIGLREEEREGIGRWRREEKGDDSDERMRFINTVRWVFLFIYFLKKYSGRYALNFFSSLFCFSFSFGFDFYISGFSAVSVSGLGRTLPFEHVFCFYHSVKTLRRRCRFSFSTF